MIIVRMTIPLARFASLTALMTLSMLVRAGASEPPATQNHAPLEFYNLFELLNKTERIVVADIGPTEKGLTSLRVQQTLKAPESDPKYMDPERFKRAEALLNDNKLQLAPLPALHAPSTLKIIAGEHIKLPPEGTQAIFFLWERLQGDGGADAHTYNLSHPQCMYDAELLPQVKAGLSRPRSKADGMYLREFDHQMALRVKQREADDALANAKSGEVVLGFSISAIRPVPSMRGDNSFGVTAQIKNTRSRSQALYDGPAGGYGVILRAKGATEPGVVLRAVMKNLATGVDNNVLELTDVTDFATVSGNGGISKELFFDSKDYPILRKFKGAYSVCVFYTSTRDGQGMQLEEPVWTGRLVSDTVPISFTQLSN